MKFFDHSAATSFIKDFALAQGKCAMISTDRRKSGGSSTLYVCKSSTPCSFFVRLVKSQRRDTNFFYVSSFNPAHDGCSGVAIPTAKQVTLMATASAACHSDSALTGPSLQSKIQTLEGVNVSLRKLYRAREVLLQDTASDYLKGCQQVRSLLTAFVTSNPGSVEDVQLSTESSFTRAFLSHPDADLISKSSQRVLGVDGAFLKHKGVDNIMLVMVGRDGNFENNILAVAICPSEDTDNCVWFFNQCLRAGIPVREWPVFSDRGNGLIAAASRLGISLHFCTVHILRNLKSKFKGLVTKTVENLVWEMQAASSEEAFNSSMGILSSLQNSAAVQAEAREDSMALYLSDIEAAKWTLYPHTYTTQLYGWRSTNFVESENAAAVSTRAKNPCQFFQYFIEKWATTKFKRYKESLKWKK